MSLYVPAASLEDVVETFAPPWVYPPPVARSVVPATNAGEPGTADASANAH